MPRLVGMGEAMGELSARSDGASGFDLNFAGDVFNTLAYVKMLGGADWDAVFVTAIGDDPLSERFASRCVDLGVGLVAAREARNPLGLYMISTDAAGERSFTYWRGQSPARRFVAKLDAPARAAIGAAEMVYFSGITLAILDASQRAALLALLGERRKAGVCVAFDPNYRPRLWESRAAAADWTARAYAVSDIAFPGVEDERDLFGAASARDIFGRGDLAGAAEVIVKAGSAGVVGRVGAKEFSAPFVKPATTVDTSGAGDSFNAGWLTARARGFDPERAAAFAAHTAAAVAGARGAIAPADVLPALGAFRA